MSKKTIVNLAISIFFIVLYFLLGHIDVKDKDHSEIGYFVILFFAGIYSVTIGLVMTIIAIKKKKYWNSILYFTSGLTNIFLSYFTIMWFISGIDTTTNIGLIILFTIIPFIGIYQILTFIKQNSLDKKHIVGN